MKTTSQKRRWSSRIGTIIRRTTKSHRLSHSISFDQDAEFVSRNCDDSGKTLPCVGLDTDIQPVLSTLCTIAESPLREAEAMQSAAASLCPSRPVYELNTPSSEYLTSQAMIDSPKSVPPLIPRIGEMSIIHPSTNQDPIYNEPQAREPPQLDFTGPSLTIEDEDQAEAPRSKLADEVSTASFYEMTHCNSIHHVPSNSSLSTTPRCQLPPDLGHINTCLPLSTSHDTLETPVTTHSCDDNIISWFSYSASSEKFAKLHTIGWLEYHFPNGNLYYFHPGRKMSTEVDLTNDTFLNLVEEFWEEEGMDVGSWSNMHRNSKSGVALNGLIEAEIWLKDIGLSNECSKMFEMWWVDHVTRTMILTTQEVNNGGAATIREDQIDMEYRYWAFMQSHPTHTVLPPNAKSAAINTLAWAWTDHLLSLRRSGDSNPFTQEECRDLMALLQSPIVEKCHHQVIQTCIVARVFLQVAQWHKSHRNNKASPTDISISKPWVVRHIFLDLVILISVLLFILLYSLGQNSLALTQGKAFVDKIIGSLGQASASLHTLDWTKVLQCMGWSD